MHLIRTYFFFLVLSFSCVNSHAQKGIDGLINAEKSFAAYSVAHSTKEAFLHYLDSNGIVFDQAKAVNGMQLWNAREIRPGILNWWPEYAEISSSNDFGYTAGPWAFQPTKNDTVVARGQYTTVWHINKNGEWKFLIDLGVGNAPAHSLKDVTQLTADKKSINKKDTSSLIVAEKDFIELFNRNPAEAYKKYLSKQSLLNRMAHAPAITSDDQRAVISSTLSSIQFTIDGWNMAPAMDMAYIYGRTILNGKTENYQHIWRHEKDGWKIALEVLRQ